MLKELFVKGPFTIGIFRKSANARVCKEFRAKLESDPNTNVSDVPVIVIASVFKVSLPSDPFFEKLLSINYSLKQRLFENLCGNQIKLKILINYITFELKSHLNEKQFFHRFQSIITLNLE